MGEVEGEKKKKTRQERILIFHWAKFVSKYTNDIGMLLNITLERVDTRSTDEHYRGEMLR